MNMFKKLWRAEPVVAGILGNAMFWPALFAALSATGHPVSDQTQHAIVLGASVLTGGAIRQTVTAPDTLDQHLADIKSANEKVGA